MAGIFQKLKEWFINNISVFEINLDKWFNELARNVQMWVELVTGPPDVINCFSWEIKSSKKGNVNFKEHNTNILLSFVVCIVSKAMTPLNNN